MSRSQPSAIKFWIIAGLTVVGAALLSATAWPAVPSAMRYESYRLSSIAAAAPAAQAQVDVTLATWLDPYNLAAQRQLAALDLTTGHDTEALAAVNHAGQGIDVTRLRLKAYLELGHTSSAAQAAYRLSTASGNDSDQVLAAAALADAGHISDALSLTSAVTSPEAARRIAYAAGGNMPLAYVLAATGLLRSPQTILIKLPDSYQRDLLLATINDQLADYGSAQTFAADAAAIDPAAMAPHQLLAQLFKNAKNLSAFKTQQMLLSRIRKQSP